MAYLLLAVGALMSLAGAYLAISGYHIVQIEEGWTSVIAGSTLFVGGFLLMGLGLVLRALLQMQSAFALRGVGAEAPDATALSPSPATVAPSKIEPAVEDQLRPEKPRRPPPPLPATDLPSLAPAEPAAPPPLLRLSDVVPTSDDTLVSPSHDDANEVYQAPETYAHAGEDVPGDDHYELETPSTSEHDLVSMDPDPTPPKAPPLIKLPPAPPIPTPAEPAKPAFEEPALSDDWLDRAFAEFDQGLPQRAPAPSQPLPPAGPFETRSVTPPLPDPTPDPAQALAAPLTAEPIAEEAAPPRTPPPIPAAAQGAEPPPRPSGPSSTVIGRYESDGTAYVMYADGSIEAQSEAGLFRFASMAELKASFES